MSEYQKAYQKIMLSLEEHHQANALEKELDIMRQLANKETPISVEHIDFKPVDGGINYCLKCGFGLGLYRGNYCPRCGQKFKWGKENGSNYQSNLLDKMWEEI